MIKEIVDTSNVKDLIIKPKKSTMLQARNQSLLCYDTINYLLIKGKDTKTAFKIFSYWVSPLYEKTMSYSLFLSEDENVLVYRIDEYDRIGLAECVMKKEKINDFKITSRVILIDGKECKDVLRIFYKLEDNINCKLSVKEINRDILGEKLFLNFCNYKKTFEFFDPYGCVELTEIVNNFLSLVNAMINNSEIINDMFLEFYC